MYSLTSFYSWLQRQHYQLRLSRQKRFPKKFVISIGNVTVGGSAKTPLGIFLLKKFIQKKIPVLMVLRGYRAKYSKKGALVQAQSRAKDVGDEALEMLHASLAADPKNQVPACIAIGRNREKVIAEYGHNISVVILDDALQNPSVYHDLELTLVDMELDYRHEKLLPFGRLREPLTALSRADVILPVMGPCSTKQEWLQLRDRFQISPKIPVFFVKRRVANWIPCALSAKGPKQKLGNSQALEPRSNCAVICAIARPLKFRRDVEDTGRKVVYEKFFSDHYLYRIQDVLMLASEAGNACDFVVTHKDWTKMKEIWQDFLARDSADYTLGNAKKIQNFFQRLWVLQQKLEISSEELFWKKIQATRERMFAPS